MSYFQPKLGYQEYYLAKLQTAMGHDVRVFTSNRYQYSQFFAKIYQSNFKNRLLPVGEFEEEGIKVVRLSCLLEFKDQMFVSGLTKKLIAFDPDIICIHDEISQVAFSSLCYKKLFKKPLVADVHADYTNMTNNLIRKLVFGCLSKNPLYRTFYKKSNAFIAITDDSKRWLTTELGIAKENITIVPLAAETSLFAPNTLLRQSIRSKYNLSDSKVLIYAGKLLPEKDIHVMLTAVAELIKKGLDIKILVVGSGEKAYESYLHSLVADLHIDSNVIFVGFVAKPELPNYYNAADVGVWPGSPSITIIEAMATGLPVVIPLLDSTSHLFEYDAGFQFKRGTVDELQKKLEALVTNESERRRKALNAQKMVAEKLNWQSVNTRTMCIYKIAFVENALKHNKRREQVLDT